MGDTQSGQGVCKNLYLIYIPLIAFSYSDQVVCIPWVQLGEDGCHEVV